MHNKISEDFRTQRVTLKDIERGQIRIPASSTAKTKSCFPKQKTNIRVQVKGHELEGKWDPRMGPDRERSGVLRLGGRLHELVTENEVLYFVHALDAVR